MSVASRILFCEGSPGGPDALLYQRVVPPKWTVRPLGSCRGALDVAARVAALLADSSGESALVLDRDFRPPPGDRGTGLVQNLRTGIATAPGVRLREFMLERSTVENYLLLDGAAWHDAWEARRLASEAYGGRWPFGASPGVEKLEQGLRQSAEEIRYYQAFRWAMSDVDRIRPFAAGRRFVSGALPADLSAAAIHELMVGTVEERQAELEAGGRDLLNRVAGAFRARLEQFDPSFMDGRGWAVWFQGKDLAKALRRLFPRWWTDNDGLGGPRLAVALAGRVEWWRVPDLAELHRQLLAT